MTSLSGTHAAIDRFLRSHSTLALASRDQAGQPMAANLFYASDDGLRLYWVSGPHSRHSRNLRFDERAAVAVHGETWSWQTITGVQMEGAVSILPPGGERDAALQLYTAKFPFVHEFEAEIARSNFYCFTPAWARLIDNGRAFGHKEEIRFERD
jgi:uncharacterized protein